MSKFKFLLKSKTFWAGVLIAGGHLVGADHIGRPEVLEAAGTVLGAAGLRDALAKLVVN